MSAYEQKVEVPDKNYQYVLFACDPYETVAFKIPNHAIDKREGSFYTNWDWVVISLYCSCTSWMIAMMVS
jgi:splicing factor 3A subunit 2